MRPGPWSSPAASPGAGRACSRTASASGLDSPATSSVSCASSAGRPSARKRADQRPRAPVHPDRRPQLVAEAVGPQHEGLAHSGESFRWIEIQPGDVFHVPGGAKHAWRNPSPEPAVMTIVSTGRIGSFFREVAAPAADPLRHFLETSERYGYWNATPEENAEVGLLRPA